MPWTKIVAEESCSIRNNIANESSDDRVITYQEAIAEAMEQAMAIDNNVIVMGEGVDAAGYIYDTTINLSEKYGKERVIETPIAEAAMTGVALGSAISGLRPILIHMRNDFILVSMDQIVNHISHYQRMFGYNIPLVIRATVARGWGSGAQHAQSFQAMFAGLDGLDIVMPYTPYDAKGLLLGGISSNKPVLFLEHRWLYGEKCHVPKEPYTIQTGKAVLRKKGKDVTVVGMSLTNREILNCINELEKEKIGIEWIDLRSINPIDIDLINNSVKKTGKLLIYENGPMNMGVCSEISARVYENCFNYLKKPIVRMGWKSSIVPAGSKMEEEFYPSLQELVDNIHKLCI